jgi:integrase
MSTNTTTPAPDAQALQAEADRYRDQGTPLGDLVAGTLEGLAREWGHVGGETVGQFLERRLEQALRMAGKTADPSVNPIPFALFRERMEAMYTPPHRGKLTCSKMRQVLNIMEAMGPETTADLTTDFVRRFIEARPPGESPNTTYTVLGYLRALCNIAAAENWVRPSPFAVRRQWVRRATPKMPRVHSREEISRVLDLLAQEVAKRTGRSNWKWRRLQALIATAAYTGMRKTEVLYLTTADIDLDGRLILLAARGKARLKTEAAAQPIPIPEGLAAILADWLPRTGCTWAFPNFDGSAPWTGGSPGHRPLDRLKTVGKRCGVPGFTFQSLRHSWATHAEYWGLTDAQIQRVLRHTNTRTQWHYRHGERQNLREIAKSISFGLKEAPAADGGQAPANGGPTP